MCYLKKQDFIVHTIELADMFFVLEEAVEARRLRFVVGDAMLDGLGRICWKMFVLGCAASEGGCLNNSNVFPPWSIHCAGK